MDKETLFYMSVDQLDDSAPQEEPSKGKKFFDNLKDLFD